MHLRLPDGEIGNFVPAGLGDEEMAASRKLFISVTAGDAE